MGLIIECRASSIAVPRCLQGPVCLSDLWCTKLTPSKSPLIAIEGWLPFGCNPPQATARERERSSYQPSNQSSSFKSDWDNLGHSPIPEPITFAREMVFSALFKPEFLN